MLENHQKPQTGDIVQEESTQKEKQITWKPLSFIDYYYDKNPYSYLTVEDSHDFLGYLFYFFKERTRGANFVTDNGFSKKGIIKVLNVC